MTVRDRRLILCQLVEPAARRRSRGLTPLATQREVVDYVIEESD
jgi:hypothetical protein